MTLHISWGNDTKTILLFKLEPGWSWQDFYLALDDYLHKMESVEHRVHLVIYSTEKKIQLPPDALNNIPKLLRLTHPREDKTVVVGHVPLLAPIMELLKKTFGLRYLVNNYFYVETLDEAFALLEGFDIPRDRLTQSELHDV